MHCALEAAANVRALLLKIERGQMSDDARRALNQDLKYIERAIDVLNGSDADAVMSLWREVQYLSKFFGGDYATGENRLRLDELSSSFQDSLDRLAKA